MSIRKSSEYNDSNDVTQIKNSNWSSFTALEILYTKINKPKKPTESLFQPSHSCFYENFKIDPDFESRQIQEFRFRLGRRFLETGNTNIQS